MKLIILDRDGVINQESRAYIKNPAEWLPIASSLDAIAKLTSAGYTIAIATNQSGVGRGYFTLQGLQEIHNHMLAQIQQHGGKIYKIYFCPHTPTDNCNCRKPRTGMFAQLAADLNLAFHNQQFSPELGVIFVGDSVCDVELGLATGCKFFLTAGAGSDGDDTLSTLSPEQRQKITMVKDLHDVVERILA